MVRLTGRLARPLSAGILAAGLLAGLGAVPTARAAPAGSPAAQAAALQAEVTSLQTAAEVASQRYDAVQARFGAAVTAQLSAQGVLGRAEAVAASRTDGYAAQARALYESGGSLGLLASVFGGGGLAEAASTYQDFVFILNAAHRSSATTDVAVRAAERAERRLAVLSAQQTSLQQAAARAAAAVQADLARTQALLAAASAQVRALATEQAVLAGESAAAAAYAVLQSALGRTFGGGTAPNSVAAAAIAAAKSRLGDPYVWGGTGPDVFDCSGLTQWSYARAGVSLPRVAAEQYNVGVHVALSALQPGDLLFWATNVLDPSTIHHVAMYLGGGMMIEAPHTGAFVRIVPVYLDGYIGAVDPTAPSAG